MIDFLPPARFLLLPLFLLPILYFLSLSAFSAEAPNAACERMRGIYLRMSVANANIANAQATHTPEGGPYRRRTIACQGSECRIVPHYDVKLVYAPDHADASRSGMVAYPNVDVAEEMKTLVALQKEYEDEKPNCDL